ncbi:MAG: nucleoside monophosphate kinase [Arsenophonus sp. NC-PE1-MAG3]
MSIIFLGAPGTGKGTQAEFIMTKYGILKFLLVYITHYRKDKYRIESKIKELIDNSKIVTN